MIQQATRSDNLEPVHHVAFAFCCGLKRPQGPWLEVDAELRKVSDLLLLGEKNFLELTELVVWKGWTFGSLVG